MKLSRVVMRASMKVIAVSILTALGIGIANAGTETHKQVNVVNFLDTGVVIFAVLQPGTSATDCYYSIIGVPTSNSTLANRWISLLLAAKVSGSFVSLTYTPISGGGCQLTQLQIE